MFQGKTLGPRPELVKEFLDKTGNKFYMYQSDRFLEFAAEHFKQDVKPEIVDEVRDLRMHDLKKHKVKFEQIQKIELLGIRVQELRERLAGAKVRFDRIKALINEDRQMLTELAPGEEKDETLRRLGKYRSEVKVINDEMKIINDELDEVIKELRMAQVFLQVNKQREE